MGLSAAQIAQYERDGYLAVEHLFSLDELEPVRRRSEEIGSGQLTHFPKEYAHVESAVATNQVTAPTKYDSLRKLEYLAWYDDLFLTLAKDPRIVEVVEMLLETPNLKLLADETFMKPPHHGSAKEFHQDAASWPWLVPQAWVTAWLALDDVTLVNGALQFIAGSHKLGLIPVDCVDNLQTDDVLAKEVTVPVGAGGCIFLHSLSLHATRANTTPHRRRAHAMRYVAAESKSLVDMSDKPGYRADLLLIQGQESSARYAV